MKKKAKIAYRFKITMKDGPFDLIEGKPFSVLIIYGNQSLSTLAKAIIKSFNFYYDHCYGFYDN